MVGCSAFGCSNRSEKGFLMKVFPKDPTRRKLWASKVKREGWVPTNTSFLCDVHFEESMWEKTRQDGKRKLKLNAVPTIFCFTPKTEKQKRKLPTERSRIVKKQAVVHFPDPSLPPLPTIEKNTTIIETQPQKQAVVHFPDPSLPPLPTIEKNTAIIETQAGPSMERNYGKQSSTDASSVKQSAIKPIDSPTKKKKSILQTKLQTYQTSYTKIQLHYQKHKLQLQVLRKQNKKLIEEKKSSESKLKSVFNDDQIRALKRRSTKFMKWSNETVKKALKLKFACGNRGYEELLRQNYPLPSLRTLRRHLKNPQFERDILKDFFSFLQLKVTHSESEDEKDCVSVLDKMATTPAHVNDVATS